MVLDACSRFGVYNKSRVVISQRCAFLFNFSFKDDEARIVPSPLPATSRRANRAAVMKARTVGERPGERLDSIEVFRREPIRPGVIVFDSDLPAENLCPAIAGNHDFLAAQHGGPETAGQTGGML